MMLADFAVQQCGMLRQKGFTLLEVVLALGISGMVIGVAVNFYMQSNTVNTMTRSYQIIGDNGSTAMAILGAYIRDSGYGGNDPWAHFNPVEGVGTDCNFAGHCSENNTTSSDALALRSNPASNRACNGAVLEDNEVVINRFFIDGANNLLRCTPYSVSAGNIITPANFEIQDGIEQMQVEYLLVDNTVTADPNLANATGILGISVSLLVSSSFDDQLLSESTRTYRLLENTPLAFTNTKEPRQVFQSSFVVNSLMATRR